MTFGGGYAMITLIEREVVNKRKWIKKEDILDVFTIAQTVPGAVAINSAIFIGYRVAGLLGAIFALTGIILPTLIIVIGVSFTYYFFHENPIVKAAFNGIGAAVIALIVHAGFVVARTAIVDVITLLIALISIVVLLALKLNPILVIIGGFGIGMIISNVKKVRENKGETKEKKEHA